MATTSSSDRIEAAREALAYYEARSPRTVTCNDSVTGDKYSVLDAAANMAAALRAMIDPPETEDSPEQIAARIMPEGDTTVYYAFDREGDAPHHGLEERVAAMAHRGRKRGPRMIFSSGKRGHLNSDPQPYRCTECRPGSVGERMAAPLIWCGFDVFDPRPEYDQPLSNPANPILSDLREARKRGDDFTDAESCLARLDDMMAGSDAWSHELEHIEHAERVLGKLFRIERLQESETNS